MIGALKWPNASGVERDWVIVGMRGNSMCGGTGVVKLESMAVETIIAGPQSPWDWGLL